MSARLAPKTVTTNYGVFIGSGKVLIRDSYITGASASVINFQSVATVRILNTVFNGVTSGIMVCVGGMTTGLIPYGCPP